VPIRLVLVDDHPIVLHGLQQLFGSQSDFDVVAACSNGVAAVAEVRRHQPDVLLADLRMEGMNGLDLLRALSTEGLKCRTIVLTAAAKDGEIVEAMRLGAMGVVLKDISPDALVNCVRSVHRGEQWIDRDTLADASGGVLKRGAVASDIGIALTPREIEIVQMIAKGLRNKAIAERLAISEGTVKVHLHNIYEKLGVDGRLELVLCAQQKGLA
jgi:DNA-binding NarL/FixJ family response regulator